MEGDERKEGEVQDKIEGRKKMEGSDYKETKTRKGGEERGLEDKTKGKGRREDRASKRESAKEDLRRSYLQCGGYRTIPQYLVLGDRSDRPLR